VHIYVRRKKLYAEVDDLQAHIDKLLAADAALDARTLDADGEAFTATESDDEILERDATSN